jgi:spore germination protein GerM
VRRRRGVLVATLMAAGLAGAACSAPVDSGPRALRAASIPADLRGATSTTTTTLVVTGESEEVTIYFLKLDPSTGTDRLVPVKRRVSPPVTAQKVLQKLFSGPTQQERLDGLRTNISPDSTVLSVPIEAKIATVNYSRDFAFGAVPEQIKAFAQVVFTAADVEGVTGVLFAQNGHREEVPQGDGSSTSAPLGRASYAQVTPR